VLFRHRTKLEIFGHNTDTTLQSDTVIMREILNTLMKENYCF
jgi:TnpA family transposase